MDCGNKPLWFNPATQVKCSAHAPDGGMMRSELAVEVTSVRLIREQDQLVIEGVGLVSVFAELKCLF